MGNLVENKRNVAEDESSILASIDEPYTEYDSDFGSIIESALEEILDGNYVHPDINSRDSGSKIRDCIRQKKSNCKQAEFYIKDLRTL